MNKKLNNTLATLMLLAIGGLCSCTDTWDEHYDGVADSNMFDGTIMEMLQQNPELSNFAKVVEATGFDAELSSSQSYTLWAPENSALTDAEWNSWLELAKTNKKEVINQLIKNHMTRYNISLDEESHIIKLLNTKTGHMSDNSQSLFGSSLITSPNNACKNGVVHIIAKAQPYLRNLYEEVEIMHNQWKKDNAISDPEDTMVSMYTFLKKYNADSLDQQRSVSIGVDENGEYIWIDSVMRRNNTILNGLDAMLYTEDSVYSVILPSVGAYQQRYSEAEKVLSFNPHENAADTPDARISTTDSLRQYYANLFAMTDLFYNDNFNQHPNDSVVSTEWGGGSRWENHRYYEPYAAGGIFDNNNVNECSNGKAYYYEEYPLTPYDQFMKKIDVVCSASTVDLSVDDKAKAFTQNCNQAFPTNTVTYLGSGKTLSFVDIQPSTKSANPTVTFQIRNTLKTTYDMYLVYCPLWVTKYASYEDAHAAAVLDSIAYDDGKGDRSKENWNDLLRPYYFQVNTFERTDNGRYPLTSKGNSVKNPADNSKYFVTNVENAVDTVYMGQLTPDYSYYQTDKEGILVQLDVKITSSKTKQYSREMYLCKIVLKPHEEETSGN
ncbi:MAG: fasciclin domain-containing protein [Prevotellaceae bacterium]|nr:fasciclin domain-containing protein [Candidatus Minthosoma caballi]MBQ0104075.1 fasciclin domain-containing protein [Candidatus Colivivens caballi]